jgi:hypothetical protein
MYTVTRTILNGLRSIEPLIMGLVFVIWVGIGVCRGSGADSASIASLGKLYSDKSKVTTLLNEALQARAQIACKPLCMRLYRKSSLISRSRCIVGTLTFVCPFQVVGGVAGFLRNSKSICCVTVRVWLFWQSDLCRYGLCQLDPRTGI